MGGALWEEGLLYMIDREKLDLIGGNLFIMHYEIIFYNIQICAITFHSALYMRTKAQNQRLIVAGVSCT